MLAKVQGCACLLQGQGYLPKDDAAIALRSHILHWGQFNNILEVLPLKHEIETQIFIVIRILVKLLA